MNEVGEGPDDGHAGEGNAEQDDVQEADAQDVRQPHPSAVHHSGVGVHLAVRRAHVHDGAGRPLNSAAGRKQNSSSSRGFWTCRPRAIRASSSSTFHSFQPVNPVSEECVSPSDLKGGERRV